MFTLLFFLAISRVFAVNVDVDRIYVMMDALIGEMWIKGVL